MLGAICESEIAIIKKVFFSKDNNKQLFWFLISHFDNIWNDLQV